MLKPEVALIELEHDSNDIMYSSIIKIDINYPNQYEFLSLAEFSFFLTLNKHFKTSHAQNY
jgi:hypothetical protein